MERTPTHSATASGTRPRRSLVPILSTILLLQASLGAGMVLSPMLSTYRGRIPEPGVDPHDQVVRWRRSMADRKRDPVVGRPVPALALKTLAGGALSLDIGSAERTVLLFLKDGAG